MKAKNFFKVWFSSGWTTYISYQGDDYAQTWVNCDATAPDVKNPNLILVLIPGGGAVVQTRDNRQTG